MPKINKLPINAGITKLITQIASEVARMPVIFALKIATSSMLAFQRMPSSVSNAILGIIASIRNTTLIDQKVCHQFTSTLKSRKKRKYWTTNTPYRSKHKDKILNSIVALKLSKTLT